MISKFTQEMLHEMAGRWTSSYPKEHQFNVYTDTTDFFKVNYGDIIILGEKPFLVLHNTREGRFGLDDEVKYWVKRAIELETGEMKIVKLVFYETFMSKIGGLEVECYRSPRKEARILKLVDDHDNFMHGYSIIDEKDNLVRVLDIIKGKTLYSFIEDCTGDHEQYFHKQFPMILDRYVECIDAIRFLHENGEKHGDIRRDHIIIDRETGIYRWIDFDYNYRHRENIYGYDLFGLGNLLIYITGKGDVLLPNLKQHDSSALNRLTHDDLNIVFHNRVANLQKVYPYIPESLNNILMYFSNGTPVFYEHTRQLLDDIGEVRSRL
jgi:serine/threonine protein kinase